MSEEMNEMEPPTPRYFKDPHLFTVLMNMKGSDTDHVWLVVLAKSFPQAIALVYKRLEELGENTALYEIGTSWVRPMPDNTPTVIAHFHYGH